MAGILLYMICRFNPDPDTKPDYRELPNTGSNLTPPKLHPSVRSPSYFRFTMNPSAPSRPTETSISPSISCQPFPLWSLYLWGPTRTLTASGCNRTEATSGVMFTSTYRCVNVSVSKGFPTEKMRSEGGEYWALWNDTTNWTRYLPCGIPVFSVRRQTLSALMHWYTSASWRRPSPSRSSATG